MLDHRLRRARALSQSIDRPHLADAFSDQAIRLASLVDESMVDGPGMRFVVFVQGCPHRCPGCHNPGTHLPIGGKLMEPAAILARYDQYPANRGITFSGGEPFEQAGLLLPLARAVQARGGDTVTYTGYRLEDLLQKGQENPAVAALLAASDLLIDGRFVLSQRCLDQPFVGSTNQRLIARSLAGNRLLQDIPQPPGPAKIRRLAWSGP